MRHKVYKLTATTTVTWWESDFEDGEETFDEWLGRMESYTPEQLGNEIVFQGSIEVKDMNLEVEESPVMDTPHPYDVFLD